MRSHIEGLRMHLRLGLGFAVVLAGALVTGCTEGGTSNPAPVVNVSVPTPLPTSVPTATPAPTATPVPTPVAMSLSTSSLAMTVVGQATSFTVTENGYAGALNASNGSPSCAGIATVAPASANGPTATFTVTAAAAGTCQIKVQDTNGQTVAVGVAVTTTGGSISSKRRE